MDYAVRFINVVLCMSIIITLFLHGRAYWDIYTRRSHKLTLGLAVLVGVGLLGAIERMISHAPLTLGAVLATGAYAYILYAIASTTEPPAQVVLIEHKNEGED